MGYEWRWLEHRYSEMPERILEDYRSTIMKLIELRKRLVNPVNTRGKRKGKPLSIAYIRILESDEQYYTDLAKEYRKLIKIMVKYGILPSNDMISGKGVFQFIFSLHSMVKFPFLGKVVFYANETMKQLETEKEQAFDLLIESLEKAAMELKNNRSRYLSTDPREPSYKKYKNQGNRFEVIELNEAILGENIPLLIKFLVDSLYRNDYKTAYGEAKFILEDIGGKAGIVENASWKPKPIYHRQGNTFKAGNVQLTLHPGGKKNPAGPFA